MTVPVLLGEGVGLGLGSSLSSSLHPWQMMVAKAAEDNLRNISKHCQKQ
jgi:hypothetical protein